MLHWPDRRLPRSRWMLRLPRSGAPTWGASTVRRTGTLGAAFAAAGVAMAVFVGLDGSPAWQLARMLAVGLLSGGVLMLMARLSARWRGWLAVAAGVPAVAIAAGLAPHWVDRGPMPVQLTAAVLAVCASGLVIGGTAVATQSLAWWRRAALSVLVVAATATAMFVIGPPIAATNVPRPALGAGPRSVGLDARELRVRAADGVELAGWYVESSNRAAVVLRHGAGSTRSDVLGQAAVLAGAGFGVLMLDARGHGATAGRAMDFGWYGDVDIAAGTAYLAQQPDVDRRRIGVVGLSMGGEEAIGASGRNPLIRAVVAEGATARVAADKAWLSQIYGARGAVQEQIERIQQGLTDVLTSAPTPVALRAAVGETTATRYLLIAAGRVADEIHAADHIAGAAPDRVSVWTVPDAGHTAGLATAPAEWTHRVVGFLADTLLGPVDTG